jgi:cysteine-rich repeat protein
VLFTGSNFRNTWEWDGARWIDKTPAVLPSEWLDARSNFDLVYDSAREVVVLFGGQSNLDARWRQDTWEWDGTKWREKTPSVASDEIPIARGRHAMVYDSLREVVVLFGGDFFEYLQDTWEWNGTRWTNLTPEVVPPEWPCGRDAVAMAYDSARGRTILFGGSADPFYSAPFQDLWEWDGTGWMDLTPAVIPPEWPRARSAHAMVYDSSRGVVVLFGGLAVEDTYENLQDLWEWDGNGWVNRTPLVIPAEWPDPRCFHAMAYDSSRGIVVLFGGDGVGFQETQDIWEWDGESGEWMNKTPAVIPAEWPEARANHAMAYDTRRGVVTLSGGSGFSSEVLTIWEWDGTNWTNLTPSEPPPEWPTERSFHGTVYDQARDVMVVFGGWNGFTGYSQETWEWRTDITHPGLVFSAESAGAGFDLDSITGMQVRAYCGGRYFPYQTADTGATLFGWSSGRDDRIGPGDWVPLVSNDIGIGESEPYLPPPEQSLLQWHTGSAVEARRFLVGSPAQASFHCRPGDYSGFWDKEAVVGMDYIEVRVSYRTEAACGDGIVGSGESCEDGNTVDGDGCSSTCLVEGGVCGDGVRNASEACDDFNTEDGDGCRGNCGGLEICGDGYTDADEACDDGNTWDGDGCSADCLRFEICGDGITDAFEVCDDDNNDFGDGCRGDCRGLEVCGDSIRDPGETCDDGNDADGDGCSHDCLEELLYDDYTMGFFVLRWQFTGGDLNVTYDLAASTPTSLRMGGGGASAQSVPLDSSSCTGLTWRYQGKRGPTAPGPSAALELSYWNGTDWVAADAWPGEGVVDPSFTQRQGVISAVDAFHSDLQIQLNSIGGGVGLDDYYIDDFTLLCSTN